MAYIQLWVRGSTGSREGYSYGLHIVMVEGFDWV